MSQTCSRFVAAQYVPQKPQTGGCEPLPTTLPVALTCCDPKAAAAAAAACCCCCCCSCWLYWAPGASAAGCALAGMGMLVWVPKVKWGCCARLYSDCAAAARLGVGPAGSCGALRQSGEQSTGSACCATQRAAEQCNPLHGFGAHAYMQMS